VHVVDGPAQPGRFDGLDDRVGDILGGQPNTVALPFDVECLGDTADEKLVAL
jgi:hypothetical protein